MRSFAIAAFVAAANAFPAQYNYDPPSAVTVTEVTEVYTTVYDDEPAAPTTPVYNKWKPATTPAAPVVVVTETPAYEAPAATTPTPEAPAATTPTPEAPAATTPAYEAPAATTPVVSAAPAPAATSAAASAAAKAPTDYAQTVVDHHNAHRANHSAPALVWDAGLAATALKIAQSCNYAHDVYGHLTLPRSFMR